MSVAAIDPQALVDSAEAHGVLPLVAARLLPRRDLPDELTRRLEEGARRAIVDDLVQETELRRLLQAFAAAGLRPVLMKGAHLAYAYYDRPDLRPRVDTDILVARGEEMRRRTRAAAAGLRAEQSRATAISFRISRPTR